jgi:ATP-binding cassette subfamily B protein
MAWYWSTSDFVCMGQKALVLAAGGYWLAKGEIQVGAFYFFLAVVTMFIWPIRMMGRILTELGKAMVAITRIGEILEHPREAEPEAAGSPAGRGKSHGKCGGIHFDRVSFSHGEKAVLDMVSFAVEPGQTLALLGPSGSGKSTIVNLLLRFYDADAGTIAIDGCDITRLPRKQVRSMIAVVMQEPFLYSKTLRENIRLGRMTAPDDEILEAAVIACVHDSITEFEKGYDTLIGERGVTLSGGQRQRVALARALLEEPAILILDDALSAVDTETEAMILEALKRRRGRHTTIVIAHRLSTLMHADRILVLESGQVVQTGTHESLVAEDGLYRRLWQIQTDIEEEISGTLRAASAAGP